MEVDFTSVNLDFKLRDGGLQNAYKWTPETVNYTVYYPCFERFRRRVLYRLSDSSIIKF